MKTMMIVAAAVIPRWRTRVKIVVLNIEMSAPGGGPTVGRKTNLGDGSSIHCVDRIGKRFGVCWLRSNFSGFVG